MIRGSVTVFIAMVMTAMFSVIFAFLELSRVTCLRAEAEMFTQQAADAVLASYNIDLREKYGLLMWEETSDNVMEMTALKNLQKGVVNNDEKEDENNYLELTLDDIEISAVQLATDDNGAAFKMACAAVAPEKISELTINELISIAKEAAEKKKNGNVEDDASDSIDKIDAEKERQKSAQDSTVQNGTEGTGSGNGNAMDSFGSTGSKNGQGDAAGSGGIQFEVNPIDWFKKFKKNGWLGLVTDDVSAKRVDLSDSVSKRTLQEGNWPETTEVDFASEMMFRSYLVTCFSNKLDGAKDGNALDYEMEYIINGFDSDKKNLSAVVVEIGAIREAYNIGLLETDAERKSIVEGIAITLSSMTVIPVSYPLLKYSLIAVWTVAESVHDLQMLFDGQKIKFAKTKEDWYTDLRKIGSKTGKTEKNSIGLDYKAYLAIMMELKSDSKLVSRSMDIIEKNTGTKMDHMVTKVRCNYTFKAPVLFWKFVSLGDSSPKEYVFETTNDISFN